MSFRVKVSFYSHKGAAAVTRTKEYATEKEAQAEKHNFRIACETEGNRKRTVFQADPTTTNSNHPEHFSFFAPLDAQSKKKFKAMKQAQKEIAIDLPPHHPSLQNHFTPRFSCIDATTQGK
jgi:hypothetical protein